MGWLRSILHWLKNWQSIAANNAGISVALCRPTVAAKVTRRLFIALMWPCLVLPIQDRIPIDAGWSTHMISLVLPQGIASGEVFVRMQYHSR